MRFLKVWMTRSDAEALSEGTATWINAEHVLCLWQFVDGVVAIRTTKNVVHGGAFDGNQSDADVFVPGEAREVVRYIEGRLLMQPGLLRGRRASEGL